jgi:hypothetical protein
MFDEHTSKIVLHHLCSVCKLSERELIANYDIFEKASDMVFNYSARIILASIKKEILIKALVLDQASQFKIFSIQGLLSKTL